MDAKLIESRLQEFLTKAGFKIDSFEVALREPQECQVNIATTNAVELIGHRGEVLQAIQHLVKIMFRQQGVIQEGETIRIDVDSYRKNQEKSVLTLAERRAKEVQETGQKVYLPPMSSFFRRIVHLHIKEKFPALLTFSQGEGAFRAVCISSGEMTPGDDVPSDLYADLDV